jgi:hypothetical protein
LNEIKNDRPAIMMKKCKISTWEILLNIWQQMKIDQEVKIEAE